MSSQLKVFSDGGARGNPGQAAIGVVVLRGEQLIKEISKKIGTATNNVAEYQAVIEGLNWLALNQKEANLPKKGSKIFWFLDSKLVVEQLSGRWRIKDPRLKGLRDKVVLLFNMLECEIEFIHVPREKNQHADKLVNQALDA